MSKRSKILVFDIESGGVQGLKADRSILLCFGYKWLGDKKTTVLKINDFKQKHCQDDLGLVRAAYGILSEAEALIAHFGEGFDKPYMQAKLLQAGCPPVPDMKLTDTCLLSRKHLCLSSSRLANLASFLKVKTLKMEKGSGWPDWWMGALMGDKKSIDLMAKYCAVDVQCLEECYLSLRHIIPTRYLPINPAIGEKIWTCSACSGHRYRMKGTYWSEKGQWQRLQCCSCGRWGHSAIKQATVPKI